MTTQALTSGSAVRSTGDLQRLLRNVLFLVSFLLVWQYSIHQITDLMETDLTGNWRGMFGHKNGAVMVVVIFFGIYIARACNHALGIAITMPVRG